MKKKLIVNIIAICFLITACSGLNQRQEEFSKLTTYQKAQYVIKQSKKVEDHYKEIVKLYSDSYGDYITNPSKENLNSLVRMRDIHVKTVKIYDEWRPLQNQLIGLVELYSESIDSEIIKLTAYVLILTKQILIQEITKGD